MNPARRYRVAVATALAAVAAFLAASGVDSAVAAAPSYPESPMKPVTEVLHGVSITDPYRWLEDPTLPETREWMDRQDRLAREHLSRLPGRTLIADRLRELYYVESVGAPVRRGERWFYNRRAARQEKAVLCWRESESSPERVLLDPNAWPNTSLGVWAASWDGRRVAYALRPNNADEATLHVIEVDTGKVSEVDVIPGAKYAVPQWTPSGDGFYYAWLPTDPSIPVDVRPGHTEIRFHRLGSDPAGDPVLHPALRDPTVFLRPALSRDGRWLFAYRWKGWNEAAVHVRDLEANEPGWKPLCVGKPFSYEVTAWKRYFYIFTNEDAPRGRVFRVPTDRPDRARWTEIVPEREATLESVQVLGGRLVLRYLENAATRMEVRTLEGKPGPEVRLPGLGTASALSGDPEQVEAFYSYQSFTEPPRVLRLSTRTGRSQVWSEVRVPVDPSPYVVEQVWFPSRDGTRISMFVVRRRDMPRDGSTPFLLGGYGGFNVNQLPAFSSGLYPWLEAGGGYALPNLRGGGEYGEEWHKAGMLDRKQNVFDDFLSAAEFLVREKYTRPDRLAIRGGSNGGLLVGAAMTQRPDLFRAVVCAVPLLDMVRYHRFGSGRTWIPEYGTAEREEDFRWLHAYSPYHRVRPGTAYPAVLMLSADTDDRVDPLHARKMTALLQKENGNGRPVLLRIERNAGHGGAGMVREQVEQGADAYAFLMRELGMTPGPPTGTPAS